MTSNCSLAVSFFARQNNLSLFRLHFILFLESFSPAAVHHRTPPAMDDGKLTTFTEHITTHGTTVLEVVYTNDPRTMERIIKKYEEWLKEEKNKLVGLDLEHTGKSSYIRQGIAVVQLFKRQHVLVYHYCRSERSQALVDFLQQKAVTFTSVDTRNDKTMLARDASEFQTSTTSTSRGYSASRVVEKGTPWLTLQRPSSTPHTRT